MRRRNRTEEMVVYPAARALLFHQRSCDFQLGDIVRIKTVFHMLCQIRRPADADMRYELVRKTTHGASHTWDLKCMSGDNQGKSFWAFLPSEALCY